MIHIDTQNKAPEIVGFLAKGTQRDDVLREMADYLVKRGAVKDSYGDAVIQRENTYPTGIPAEPIAVAIPHSDRNLVLNTTILVAKLVQNAELIQKIAGAGSAEEIQTLVSAAYAG